MVRPRLIGTVTNAIRRACDRYRKTRTQGTEGRVPTPHGAIAIDWGGDLDVERVGAAITKSKAAKTYLPSTGR